MTEGFCTAESRDVPIGPDRKCLADGAWALPPSTGCVHQKLLGVAWSACDAERPCRPVAPGTWRAILGQQAKAVAKRDRDRDRAARRFAAGAPQAPKLASSRRPTGGVLGLVRCAGPDCLTMIRPVATGAGQRRRFCSVACGNRARRGAVERRACSVCAAWFTPALSGNGRFRRTCSTRCARRQGNATRRTGVAS